MELMDEHMGTFCIGMVTMVGARSLTFPDFWHVGLLSSLERRNPLLANGGWWTLGMPSDLEFTPMRRRSYLHPVFLNIGPMIGVRMLAIL